MVILLTENGGYGLIHIWTYRTTEDIVMPLSNPIRGKNGRLIEEVPLAKGTTIVMGLWGSNINPAVWGEDAETFKPERWLSNLPSTVADAHIPGVYSNLWVSRVLIGRWAGVGELMNIPKYSNIEWPSLAVVAHACKLSYVLKTACDWLELGW